MEFSEFSLWVAVERTKFMRSLFILIACIVVVGVVISVVMLVPTPTKNRVEVARLDLNRQPEPVLKSDPAAERILDFFPEPKESLPLAPSPEMGVAPPQPAPAVPPEAKPEMFSKELDRNRLLNLIDDWIYVDFSQVGSAKLGRIQITRENSFLEVNEGTKLQNGIIIAQLTRESAMLKLGEASFLLRLAQEPKFFEEVKQTLRPLTPEEQKEAFDYYMARFGDKFKEQSKDYQPPAGAQNPRQITPEDRKKGLEQYFEKYGKQFQKEGSQYKVPFPYGEKQQELYQKYWKKFHPDQPMPEFDKLYINQNANPNATNPGSRIQPSGDTQPK